MLDPEPGRRLSSDVSGIAGFVLETRTIPRRSIRVPSRHFFCHLWRRRGEFFRPRQRPNAVSGTNLPLPPLRSPAAAAWDDVVEGMSKSWMWWTMATQDIALRYRGSVLGPFWLTISMAIMIAALGLIYSRLFNMEINRYLPFLTVGLVVWQFVSSVMIDGCNTFLA